MTMTDLSWTGEGPPPGSLAARERGCRCPISDNNYGAGSYKGGYITRLDCPLHGDRDD